MSWDFFDLFNQIIIILCRENHPKMGKNGTPLDHIPLCVWKGWRHRSRIQNNFEVSKFHFLFDKKNHFHRFRYVWILLKLLTFSLQTWFWDTAPSLQGTFSNPSLIPRWKEIECQQKSISNILSVPTHFSEGWKLLVGEFLLHFWHIIGKWNFFDFEAYQLCFAFLKRRPPSKTLAKMKNKKKWKIERSCYLFSKKISQCCLWIKSKSIEFLMIWIWFDVSKMIFDVFNRFLTYHLVYHFWLVYHLVYHFWPIPMIFKEKKKERKKNENQQLLLFFSCSDFSSDPSA